MHQETAGRGTGTGDVRLAHCSPRLARAAACLAVRAARLIAVAGLLAHSVVPAVRATAGSAAVQQASVAQGVAAPVPLVDAAFLDEVRARLADAFRRDDDYAYRERRTEINTNPFGRVGTGDVELYEVYPSPTPGLTYRRRLTEHGVALSDAALVRQDREYQARAAGVRRRLAADAAERTPETPEERFAAEDDDIFNVLQFSVERRELFEGRPAIVVTFGPRPGADPQTQRGDLVRKFAGTAWIDEAAREVRFVEATSVDSISFGLGLAARVSEGAAATMRREQIDDGVWMPTQVTFTGRGRAALFLRGLSIDYAEERFDYRPASEVPIPGAP